jgi:hypothetical protein
MRKIEHVTSSNVDAIAYSERDGLLLVKFKSRRTYKYRNVPVPAIRAFVEAPSKGQFLNANIKPRYEFELVPEVEAAMIFTAAAGGGPEAWFVVALDGAQGCVDVSI